MRQKFSLRSSNRFQFMIFLFDRSQLINFTDEVYYFIMQLQAFLKSSELDEYQYSSIFLMERINKLSHSASAAEIMDLLLILEKVQKKDQVKVLAQKLLKCVQFFEADKYQGYEDVRLSINCVVDELSAAEEVAPKLNFRRSMSRRNLNKPLKKFALKLRISLRRLEIQWSRKLTLKESARWLMQTVANLQTQLNQDKLKLLKGNQQKIICRICEQPVEVNSMASHCNKCEQSAESRIKTLEMNLELASVMDNAFQERRNIQVKQAIKKFHFLSMNMRIKTAKKIVTQPAKSKLRRTQTFNYDDNEETEQKPENEQELSIINNIYTVIINYAEKVLKNSTEDTKQSLVTLNEIVNAIPYIESQEALFIVNRAHKCILERMEYQKKQESMTNIEENHHPDHAKTLAARRMFTKSNSISFRLPKIVASPSPRNKPPTNDPVIIEENEEKQACSLSQAGTPLLHRQRKEFKMNTSIFRVSEGSDSPKSPFTSLQRGTTFTVSERDLNESTLDFMKDVIIENIEQDQKSPSIDDKKRSSSSDFSLEQDRKKESKQPYLNNKTKVKNNFHSQEIISAPQRKQEQKKSRFCQPQKQDFEEDTINQEQDSRQAEQQMQESKPSQPDLSIDTLHRDKGYHSDSSLIKTSPTTTPIDQVGLKDFEFIRPLGKGAYGWVYLVKKKGSGDLYALKIIDCSAKNLEVVMEQLKAERNIFEILNSNFVVKAYFSFVHDHYLCFAQEYMVGGDLATILKTYTALDEIYVRHYMAEIVLALEYLRNQNIIHRDLKPENILLDSQGHAKLADFGLSEKGVNSRLNLQKQPTNVEEPLECIDKMSVTENQYVTVYNLQMNHKESCLLQEKQNSKTKKIVGTPDYIAPEILKGVSINNFTADYWSLGVIMYEMLCGIAPFNDVSVERIFANILDYNIDWPQLGDGEDCLSHVAYDLLTKLLEPDHEQRIGKNGIHEIKQHQFFKGIDWSKLLSKPGLIIPELSQKREKDVEGEEKMDQFLVKLEKSRDSDSKNLTQKLKTQLKNLERIDLLKQTSLTEAEKVLQEFKLYKECMQQTSKTQFQK